MPIRIGAVSYLNTKPLIYGLEDRTDDYELILDIPSRLADRLLAGELDIALVPSVEYLRHRSELSIVSDACIACRGEVRSVQLLFRKPPHSIRTLALDEGSRTSAVLAQILLAKQYDIRPELVSLPIAQNIPSVNADAILIIGDRAMKIRSEEFVLHWDLGEQWTQWARLPFVFAMWVARTAELELKRPALEGAVQVLQQSRDTGIHHLREIAEYHAPRYGLTVEDCLIYFNQQLHFVMGASEQLALEYFNEQSEQLGLLWPSTKSKSAPKIKDPADILEIA